MLEEFDMELVQKQNFYHFFKEHKDIAEDKSLLFRMSAFSKDRVMQRTWCSLIQSGKCFPGSLCIRLY